MSEGQSSRSGHRRALITGASAGLGRDYAHLFAADGHDVILVARRRERLEQLSAKLQSEYGVGVTVLAEDLTEHGAPARIVEILNAERTPVDFLVNNAGFGSNGPFAELDTMRELNMIQVNVAALVHLTRLLLPAMVAAGFGRILNIGSTAAFQPGPFMATYYATKAFVVHFTEALSFELQGTGVTATASCPGPTQTEFAANAGNIKSRLFERGVAASEPVARHGYQAMMRGRPVAVPGLLNKTGVQAVRMSPRSLVRRITARLNRVAKA